MAAARWKWASFEGTVVFGVYDDVTDEMIGFELSNPGRKNVRLVVTQTGEPTKVVDRDSREPVKVDVPTPGAGKRIVDREGEVDLPRGLTCDVVTTATARTLTP